MLSPFGILALFGKGYTFTHMVAEGVRKISANLDESASSNWRLLKSRTTPAMLSTTI